MGYYITLPRLYDKQQLVADHPARFKVLCAGRRFGKNILLHNNVVRSVLSGGQVAWLSPTYKNLDSDWSTVRDTLLPVITEKHEDSRTLKTLTGGSIDFWSGDNPEPIRGRKYHLFVFNEAAFIKDLRDVWGKIVRMTLADYKGRAVFSSTPNGINDYHSIWAMAGDGGEEGDNKDDWARWHFTTYDNPFIDPTEIDASRRTMTEEEYRQEVLAEFVEGAGAVFRNILQATSGKPSAVHEHPGHVLVGGIDWGKDGDFTVLSVACATCKREVQIDRFNEIDWYHQSGRVKALHNKWRVWQWLAEANSIGGPMLEKLVKMGIPVTGWTATNSSKQTLIQDFSLGLETNDLVLLDDPVGRTELQAYQARRTATGLRSYSAPSGQHDDTVIARALVYRKMLDASWQVGQAQRSVAGVDTMFAGVNNLMAKL